MATVRLKRSARRDDAESSNSLSLTTINEPPPVYFPCLLTGSVGAQSRNGRHSVPRSGAISSSHGCEHFSITTTRTDGERKSLRIGSAIDRRASSSSGATKNETILPAIRRPTSVRPSSEPKPRFSVVRKRQSERIADPPTSVPQGRTLANDISFGG